MEIPRIIPDDIMGYVKRSGKHGDRTTSIHYRLLPTFEIVVGTKIGNELMRYLIETEDELLVKIYQETATPQELAEFRVIRDKLMPKFVDLINNFLNSIEEIKRSGQSK